MNKIKQSITCLMQLSIDGRIERSRWSPLYEKEIGDELRSTQERLSFEISLIGKETVLKQEKVSRFESKTHTTLTAVKPFKGIRSTEAFTGIFDSKGSLCFESNKLNDRCILMILGSKTCSEEYLEYLRKNEISYTFAGEDGHDLRAAMSSLYSDFGIKNILLSGGGQLNGSFLNAGLIDDIYLLVYPTVDGLHQVSSLFEYLGDKDAMPNSGLSLELLSCEVKQAGIVKLHYKFHFYED